MKDFYIKLIKAAIILILLIVFVFLLADCKMENEKLRLKVSLLQDDLEKTRVETREIRKAYAAILIRLLAEKRTTSSEISSHLSTEEFEIFTAIQKGTKY